MGVDLETYRGRIGTFRHSQGLDVVTIVCTINFHRGMKAIGTVVFIGVLLLIAGIESNPGPTTLDSCTCSSRPKKIKVTGLPENIDEEDLNNLFENKRRQGGGDVRHVQVFKRQRTAIIEFEESEAVEIVLKKRPISIKKTKVSVNIFHSSNTVEVTNIPTEVSVESLKKYFEDQASDEDSITCVVREADIAFVTFKNEQITKQIVCKDRHTLENHRQPMMVNFHDPELVHTDQMNVTGSSDLHIDSCTCSSRPTKIKVTGLPENISEEDLYDLFENKRRQGGGDVRHVQFFESQRTAIIEFEESEAVETVLKKRPISTKNTNVSVNIFHSSNTVEVTSIPTDVSVESLKKYFEEQASDKDSITCIVREADVVFVTFKNEQITKQIAYKDRHTLENHRQPIVVNFHDPELVHTDQMNVTGSSDLNIDHGLQAFDEKKLHFKNLLERMGLLSRVDKLITVREVLSVHIVSTETQEVDERDYPWTFLQKLCTGNYRARDMYFALSDRDQSSNTSPLDNLDKESEERISPLDLFLAIYSCCDPMLKQLIFKNLYLCKLAVPFIVDQLCSSDQCPSVSVWPLRALLIESKIAQDGNTESEVLDLQSARVTFARFGRPSFSKSKVLNSLLSQDAYNTFYNFDCTYGTTKRNVSDGYVEMFWLPIIKNENSNISSPLTFFNVRGDLQMYFCERVLPFLSQITDIFVLVIEVQSLLQRFNEVQDIVKNYRYVLLIICGRLDPKDVHKVNSLKEFEASLREKYPKSIIHIVLTHECGIENNMKQVAKVISEKIETFEKDIVKTTLKDRLSNIENKNVMIDETEQSCVEGKRIATDIIEAMGTQNDAPLLWKRRVTPAHFLYSRYLGENNTKIRREQDLTQIEQLRHEMDNLRKEQINNITPAIKLFARYLVSKAESPSCLRFILAWLNIFIQLEKQKLLPQLIKENRTAWKNLGDIKSQSNPNSEDVEVQRESIKRTENQIEEASFSIELLFHEIGNIYDSIIILRKDSTSLDLPSIKTMVEVCASLFVEGNTLELIDGEAFYMPQHWIGKVFEKVSEIMGSPKVLTMSILGIQSSGKSTLLNTMFGSQFPTSVGRCTKGIQMKLLPLRIDNSFQNILILDTEGLRAPDVSDEKFNFDNQMATIITGLGDITVMNVMGENAMAIRDILQVVVHAFLRLKLADPNIDLRKRCTFIHHNVSNIMALDKMRPSVSKLMEILDSVTKDAAEMEGISDVVEFNQIIQFDMTSQVWFLPHLLEGCPPRITCEYSSQAADIKSKLLQLAISDTEKSYGSLNDVIMHARDLWKGVLTEDFVFYFRNSEEIRAYNLLESKVMHWLSEMQCFCRKKCIETSQQMIQKCSEQQELEEATEAANKLISDDLHKKEIEVKQEIDKCFNENEFKNAICRWKDETKTRFEYTCMDLRNSIKKETERFRQKRSIEIFQNSNRAEHEDKLHEKSVKLAKDAKHMSAEGINKQFENIWQEFVKKIESKSQVPTSYIFKKRLHEMYKNDALLLGLVDTQTLQFNTSVFASYNLSALLSDKINFLLKDVSQVRDTIRNIEKIIQNYITLPYSIKDENISLFLKEVKKEIKCKITWKNERLKKETKAEILVIICCYSSRLFDKHNLDPRTRQIELLSEEHVHNYLYSLFTTEKRIVWQMIHQKSPFATLKLSNIEGYADDISIPHHFFTVSKISDKKKISLVRPYVDKILSETGFQIDEFCNTDTEMSEFNIKTVLYDVKKNIENLKKHKNEFTLTNRFTIRICVHVGEYAYRKFQRHNELYQEKIARRLTNYKQSVRAQFDAYLSDRKQEDTAALLISSEIETIAREAIKLCMPSKVLHELLNTTIPSTKLDLIIDMLTDMAEGEKFFPFMVYIESPSEYAKTWITEQSKNYLFAENPTGYFKIASRSISKIFEDIYNAIDATTDFFNNNPPTLEMWMEQLNKNLKHCRIRDENIRNAKREIIKIQNVTNFNRILLDNLKESENKLKSEAENETEDTVVWGSLNPYKEVFKMYWGCEEQCRYCGEPCFKSKHDEKSSKHKCVQHRPGCCSGIQDSASKTAMLETCNFNVQKPGQIHNCLAFNFACNRVEGKSCDDSTMHLFSEYRKYLPYWDIEPDMDMSESSEFWMWFVATYKQQLADYYGYDVSNIPESWSYISKASALINLHLKYRPFYLTLQGRDIL